jgi:hypothetical protein
MQKDGSPLKLTWLTLTANDLEIERQQLLDEGREISSLREEFDALVQMDIERDPDLQSRAQLLLDRAQTLPYLADAGRNEPSDLAAIRRLRPDGPRAMDSPLSREELFDRVHAAWLGRCAGNLLGKPVEGWHSDRIWGYLKDLGEYPLSGYFHSDVPASIVEKYGVGTEESFINKVPHGVEDDDLNYTVAGLAILKKYGPGFTPGNVAEFWLENIPILRTCTAERVAYRNLAQLAPPPHSASFRNPYREWIGAQIRADFWGFAALGKPELAAEFAWRDASISHIKNGIYGEMWVAAMLAAAPFAGHAREVIEIGLSEIPAGCRLAADIREVIGWKNRGLSYDEAVASIHLRWDERNPHHWCHTNSNAQIVALGLLWGMNDFGTSICRSVQACFDTDCNGATVGSIFGMMHGCGAIPAKWTAPLRDTLETGVTGYRLVKISEVAREGFELRRV